MSVRAQCFLISHCNKTLQTWCLTQQKCIVTHRCRGEKSKIKVSTRCVPSEGNREGSIPGFSPSDLLAVFGILGYRYTTSTSAFVFTWFSLLCVFVSTFPPFTRTSDVLDQGPIPVGLIEMFSIWWEIVLIFSFEFSDLVSFGSLTRFVLSNLNFFLVSVTSGFPQG